MIEGVRFVSGLANKNCKPCEGGVDPLGEEIIADLLTQVPGWRVSSDGAAIRRDFKFLGFPATVSFINALARMANQEDHHPDLCAGYNYCNVTFTTHAINGLSENDFICAYRLNELVGTEQ